MLRVRQPVHGMVRDVPLRCTHRSHSPEVPDQRTVWKVTWPLDCHSYFWWHAFFGAGLISVEVTAVPGALGAPDATLHCGSGTPVQSLDTGS